MQTGLMIFQIFKVVLFTATKAGNQSYKQKDDK